LLGQFGGGAPLNLSVRLLMARNLVAFALVVIGGAAIAYCLVQFGCLGINPPFVAYCGHNVIGAFIISAVAAWFVLGILFVSIRAFRSNQ
jgi:hypothetical protein